MQGPTKRIWAQQTILTKHPRRARLTRKHSLTYTREAEQDDVQYADREVHCASLSLHGWQQAIVQQLVQSVQHQVIGMELLNHITRVMLRLSCMEAA